MTLRLFHVTRRAVFDGVEVHEGFVGDHAGEGQSVGRRFSGVIIAAEKVRIVFDGEDLFEEGEPVEDGGGAAAGDGDDEPNAVRVEGGEGQRHEAADARANDRVQFFDAEGVEEEDLGAHDIID